MKKFVLYGAGNDGKEAMYKIGAEKIAGFIDNSKTGEIDNLPIFTLDEYIKNKLDYNIIITSSKYTNELINSLKLHNIEKFWVYEDGKIDFNKVYSINNQRLDQNGWGELYNEKIKEKIKENICSEQYSVQTKEMLNITQKGQKILEIGCGSGETSVVLAKEGREVTALDYSDQVLKLVESVSTELNVKLNIISADASKKLPFKEKFDIIFQAGLLEHFNKKERIELLKNWKCNCLKMVSIIPNASSLAYRVGKRIMEDNNEWKYGIEMPQRTLYEEFNISGYTNIIEYTIGNDISLEFLPQDHYLRIALERFFMDSNLKEKDDYFQGYLLVTIGDA